MKLYKSKYCLLLLLSQIFVLSAYGITAKFSYTQLSKCAPTIVKFTNNSSKGAGITYTWDFGLGAIVTTTDYTVKEQVYTKSGKYRISLRVTNGTETDTTSAIITISLSPAANFSADPLYGCSPLLVKFSSKSTAGDSDIALTSWDFRNGDNASGTSVQYTYTNPGIYDVILKVTDGNGCSSTFEADKLITVAEKPKINFVASDTFACAPPLNISFTNLTSGSSLLKYNWDFGNGKTSTDFSNSSVYLAVGSYNVKLKATDIYGCSDSLIRKSYITVGYPKGILSVYDGKDNLVDPDRPFLCDGTYKFVYSTAGLPDYKWIITDNNKTSTFYGKNSLIYKVEGTGTIAIKLIYGKTSYCTDSISASFSKSYIKAGFTLNDKLFCSVPAQINLKNASQNADRISWYLSDKLISNQGETTYTITRKDIPAETYQQLYSHEVNMITLPLKLVASNAGVCFDSVMNEVTIALPVARFMPDKVSGCVPLQVSFSDSSKSEFRIDSYNYKFGNEAVTVLNNSPVTYTFTKPGIYSVSEIIKSGVCTDTSEVVTIAAGDKLVPDFTITPDEVCNGGNIHLTANASSSTLISQWRFRSPNLFDFSFSSRPDTIFAVYSDTSGFRNITLQENYNGCLSETTKKNIFKIKGPVGNFKESVKCDSSLIYHFKSVVSPATSLTWNIDTAVFKNTDSPKYTFPASGNYTVKLTALDNSSNCTLTRTKVLKVRQAKADFTLNDTIFCVGEKVKLDASESIDFIDDCYNEGFLWDFGDNSPPRRTFLTSYDHTYSSRGIDTIKLVVTADDGCMDTASKVIQVFRPAGSFTADKTSGCLPQMSINFTNTSTDNTIVGWIWNFGDKASDSTNSVKVTHTYSSNKQQTYYPTLTVYDAYQCSSNNSISAEITGLNPDFQASDNAICAGQTVTFTPADATVTYLFWDFGDGSTSGSTNTHTYTKAGEFTVSLSATKEGCRNTLTKTNYITVEKANANFTVSDSIFTCYPDTLYFVHNNSIDSPGVDFQWTVDSHTLTDRNSDSVRYTLTKPGNHTAWLTVRTLNGCTATKSSHISITGPTAVVTFVPHDICYNDVVYFKVDSVRDASQWKLFYGDGSTTTNNMTSHKYTSRGKIVPSIQLVSGGCTAISVLDTLYVSQVQAEFSTLDSTLYVCYGNKLDLMNNSIGSDSWRWAIDNVQTSTNFNLGNILLNKTGNYNIRLIAMDPHGCSDTLTKTYSVVNKPVFSISGDSVLCSGENSVSLSVNKETGWTIKWTPSSGLSSNSSFTITASPSKTTTYTALVTNTYGCTTRHVKTILVNQPYDLSRKPSGDTTIFIGEQIQLIIATAESNINYSWSPAINISCTHCNNPWVSPIETTTYTVETKNDCFDFSEEFLVNVIRDFYLEAPSAFTPNGDSNNDIFRFEGNNIANFDLKIFNRWGDIVFSTNDINQGWDGTVNAHSQNIDTYKYLVVAETIHGYKFEKKGEFLLLK